MLYEEVEKYARLSGDKNAWDTSVSRIGGYLDGYDKGIEILDKIRAEIEHLTDTINVCYYQYVNKIDVLQIIDKYKAEIEPQESEENEQIVSDIVRAEEKGI